MEKFPWLESLLDGAPMDLPAPPVKPESYQMVLGMVPEHLRRLALLAVQAEQAHLEVQKAIDARVASPIILLGEAGAERNAEVVLLQGAGEKIAPSVQFLSTWLVCELKMHFEELPAGAIITIGSDWAVFAHRPEDEPAATKQLLL